MVSATELRALLALNMAVAAAGALVVVNTVVYVGELLDGPQSGMAAMLACYGAGSMFVALAMPRTLRGSSERSVMLAGAVAAAAGLLATTVFIAVPPAPPVGWIVLGALWMTLGAATSMVSTPSARLLRRGSTTDNRTAVFTAQFSLSHACFLVAYPIAGWVGATLGQAVAALALAGVATLAAATAVSTWRPAGSPQREGDAHDPIGASGTAGQPAP